MILKRGFRYSAHGSTFVVVREHSKKFGFISAYRTTGDRRYIHRVPAADISLMMKMGLVKEAK